MAKKRRSSQFKDTSQVIDIEEARRKRQEKRKKQQQRSRQQEELVQRAATRSRVKAGRRKKNITYAVIILCIIAAIGVSLLNIVSLKSEYNEAKAVNEQLTEQKEELEEQLKDTTEDEYIEKEAREQLRMVKPGETVYIVPNQDDASHKSEESDKK